MRALPARRRLAPLAAASLLTVLAGPAAARAADPPSATTGGAARVTPTTATLTGAVNPRGSATTYEFQYGPTRSYGVVTPAVSAGSGTATVTAVADVTGLAPNTRYHYRIVARSREGVRGGADRTFTTRRQPLGLALVATPNPVTYGSPITLSGTLSGTGNAGQAIVLRQNPFPFTAGLNPFGPRLITDASGAFALGPVGVALTTQFQAVVDGKDVASAILTVPVAVRVGTRVSRTRVRKGGRVRFTGSIRPARDGAQVAVQKRTRRGGWVTVAGTITHHHRSGTLSTFRRTVRVRRSGAYRIFVGLQDGNYTSNVGRTITVRLRRR